MSAIGAITSISNSIDPFGIFNTYSTPKKGKPMAKEKMGNGNKSIPKTGPNTPKGKPSPKGKGQTTKG